MPVEPEAMHIALLEHAGSMREAVAKAVVYIPALSRTPSLRNAHVNVLDSWFEYYRSENFQS